MRTRLVVPVAEVPVWTRVALGVALVALGSWGIPLGIRAYRGEAALQAAAAHQTWGRLEDARRVLGRAADHVPGNAELHLALGSVDRKIALFRESDSATRDALDAFRQAARLNPMDAEPHVRSAMTHVQAGSVDAASVAMDEALARDPNNAFYLATLGYVRERQGRTDDAIELYRQSLAIVADDALEERLDALVDP